MKNNAKADTAVLSSQYKHTDADDTTQLTKLTSSVDEITETLKIGPFHYIFLLISGLYDSLYIM